MLSVEENKLLTQVGPGTPMGNLMRRYWQPVLLSSELPEKDGAPKRVRGEFDVTLTLSAAGQLSVTAASGTLFASQMESTPCIEPDNTLGSALTGVTFEGTVTSGVWSPTLDTLTLRGSLRKHFVFLANGDSCEVGSSDDPGLEDEDIFSRPASRMIVNGVLVGLDFADAADEVTGQVLRQP